ncbi:MAG: hypothetical protein KDA84_09960, partial [Planctomycetaceae bacterium]|nr:hypothetical protein [Planctomycetaceae bacterium]
DVTRQADDKSSAWEPSVSKYYLTRIDKRTATERLASPFLFSQAFALMHGGNLAIDWEPNPTPQRLPSAARMSI